jgi:secondary thiamine-phosphate synthase enzyme
VKDGWEIAFCRVPELPPMAAGVGLGSRLLLFGVWLERLAPFNPDPNVYRHNRTGEDDADAHLKRQVMGREVVVGINTGKRDFGPWEQVFYGEFDGHRPKRVAVKIIGE